jgi:hypothetical protein
VASASLHQFGRTVLQRVWPNVTGSEASLSELQIAGAVATLETSYGQGWKGAGAGSNNWGAINCPQRAVDGQCPGGCFPAQDSSPGQDLEIRCFKAYASADDGAAGLIREITLRRPHAWEAMRSGDIDGFSRAMRGLSGDPVYFEGIAASAAERANPELQKEESAKRHAAIVAKHVQDIATALGESVAATRGGGGGVALPLSSADSEATCLSDIYDEPETPDTDPGHGPDGGEVA